MDETKRLVVYVFATLAILLAGGTLMLGVAQNHATTLQIQDARQRSIQSTCEDINRRHDKVVAVTRALLLKPTDPPKAKLTAVQRRAQDDALNEWIGAILPKRDCSAYVSEQLGT